MSEKVVRRRVGLADGRLVIQKTVVETPQRVTRQDIAAPENVDTSQVDAGDRRRGFVRRVSIGRATHR